MSHEEFGWFGSGSNRLWSNHKFKSDLNSILNQIQSTSKRLRKGGNNTQIGMKKLTQKIILCVRKKVGRRQGRVSQNLDSWFQSDFKPIWSQIWTNKTLIQRESEEGITYFLSAKNSMWKPLSRMKKRWARWKVAQGELLFHLNSNLYSYVIRFLIQPN